MFFWDKEEKKRQYQKKQRMLYVSAAFTPISSENRTQKDDPKRNRKQERCSIRPSKIFSGNFIYYSI